MQADRSRGNRIAQLLLVVALACGGENLSFAEGPSYFLENFEPAGEWQPGPLEDAGQAVRPMQGKAEIVAQAEPDSSQFLRVGPGAGDPAVLVDASVLQAEPIVWCELLAKPMALEDTDDEEFFDFDGAVLSCFRVEGQAELHALYPAADRGESVWISTGVRFDLDETGHPVDWIRVAIRFDRATRRWDLWLNGIPAIRGLLAVTPAESSALPLWLYGHPEAFCDFDDILLGAIPPDELEAALRRPTVKQPRGRGTTFPQITSRAPKSAELRARKIEAKSRFDPAPKLRGWHLSLNTGTRTYQSARASTPGREPQITAYSPEYDDDGNRQPATITITVDAVLIPGIDLSQIRWRVAELLGYPDKLGAVAGSGDFRTGLVQTFTLSSEWVQKATSVLVWVQRDR